MLKNLRYQRNSRSSQWDGQAGELRGQIFQEGTPVLGPITALLDRLTHKACIINSDWDSYRLKQSLKLQKKGGAADKEIIS